jgi:predicted ATP-dependent serine protease
MDAVRPGLTTSVRLMQVDEHIARGSAWSGDGRQDGRQESTLRLLDVGSMLTTPPPKVEWQCAGLVVRGAVTMLAGREGLGKSLLGYALASATTTGSSVAGIECREGSALYVDAENGAQEIHRRVQGFGPGNPDRLTIAEAVGFHLEDDSAHLAALVETHRPDLLVLDSFSSVWPGDEVSKEAGDAIRRLYPLARAHGTAVLLLHHVAKGTGQYRGHTSIGASVELGFTLERTDDKTAGARSLVCWKCRPAPQPKPRFLTIGNDGERVTLSEAASDAPGGHARGTALREAMDALRALLDDEPRSARGLSAQAEVHPSTGRRALRELGAEGWACEVAGGWVRRQADGPTA